MKLKILSQAYIMRIFLSVGLTQKNKVHIQLHYTWLITHTPLNKLLAIKIVQTVATYEQISLSSQKKLHNIFKIDIFYTVRFTTRYVIWFQNLLIVLQSIMFENEMFKHDPFHYNIHIWFVI